MMYERANINVCEKNEKRKLYKVLMCITLQIYLSNMYKKTMSVNHECTKISGLLRKAHSAYVLHIQGKPVAFF